MYGILWDLNFSFSGIEVQKSGCWVFGFMFSLGRTYETLLPECMCFLHSHQ